MIAKRIAVLLCAVSIVLLLSACSLNAGTTKNAQIVLGESKTFSSDEISAAKDCVMKKFKEFEGCDLLELRYDEERSIREVNDYMSTGRGQVNGVARENIIVLHSSFYVDSSGGDGSLNPDSEYSGWMWILVRDNEHSAWRVDDWGY